MSIAGNLAPHIHAYYSGESRPSWVGHHPLCLIRGPSWAPRGSLTHRGRTPSPFLLTSIVDYRGSLAHLGSDTIPVNITTPPNPPLQQTAPKHGKGSIMLLRRYGQLRASSHHGALRKVANSGLLPFVPYIRCNKQQHRDSHTCEYTYLPEYQS